MGTAKRERQKANRQSKLEQLEKSRRKKKVRNRGLQFGIGVPVAVAILVLVVVLVNNSNDKKSTADTVPTTEVTADTTSDTTADTTADTGVDTTVETIEGPIDPKCPNEDGSSPKVAAFTKSPEICIDATKTYVATVTTNKGEFTVDLDASKAPKTVNNFVFLARYHFFDGITCHRIIPGDRKSTRLNSSH